LWQPSGIGKSGTYFQPPPQFNRFKFLFSPPTAGVGGGRSQLDFGVIALELVCLTIAAGLAYALCSGVPNKPAKPSNPDEWSWSVAFQVLLMGAAIIGWLVLAFGE
jgi:hypothetical protein